MMRRTATGLALLLLATAGLACNLARVAPTATPEIVTATISPPTTDPNLIPSLTPLGAPAATFPPGTPTVCAAPANWFVYIVQPGDTLTDLATRVGSTVPELVARNCLPNADAIFVGQSLYVPVMPPPTG